jgi:signal transduction histidine kinase
MSIRLRVTLATVALVALALATADFTAYVLLKREVYRDASNSVRRVAATAIAAVDAGQRIDLASFSSADRPMLVELWGSDGRLLERVDTRDGTGLKLSPGLLSQRRKPQTLFDQIEAIAVPASRDHTVLAAVALGPTVSVLKHLSTLNAWIGIAVMALAAVIAAVVLTVSLRPLRRIAATADAITAGSLSERAPAAPRRNEIGRVATALNRMLDQIQTAFAQRDATERRLRRFLADASHELRTPLTSIRGYAELFRRGADRRPEDLAGAMRAIEDEAARMTQLVDDLLLLARLDDEPPLAAAPVSLDRIIEAAVQAARVVDYERPLQCELQRPIEVLGDAASLRQVIDNLLANAYRHTPPGATVSVAVKQVADEAVLTVADTGPGIPPGERERIFDRFFRPDGSRSRDRGGTGLGLAIVQAIVTAHRGHVSVRDVEPHGALFEVHLPIATSPVLTCPGANPASREDR